MRQEHKKLLRLVITALLVALAMVLSWLESLVPLSLAVPGVKLGLANLVTVTILYSLGAGPAAAVNLVRILLTGFTFGNMSSVLFSVGGAVLSLLVMAACRRLVVRLSFESEDTASEAS